MWLYCARMFGKKWRLFSTKFCFGRLTRSLSNSNANERLLKVAIVGLVNAGKSQLFNTLVGRKISCVSSKISTTNRNLVGVRNIGDVQLVFTDTPGHMPASKCHRHNVDFENSISFVKLIKQNTNDVLLHVVDSQDLANSSNNSSNMLAIYMKSKTTRILVLNKAEYTKGQSVEEFWSDVYRYFPPNMFAPKPLFHASTAVSSKTHQGIDKLLDMLCLLAYPKRWLYNEHAYTPLSLEEQIQEVTRQFLFDHLPHSLPYKTHSHTQIFHNGDEKEITVVISANNRYGRNMLMGLMYNAENYLHDQIQQFAGDSPIKLSVEIRDPNS